jgi:8-oxo-dGTP pyrophosphatase MutT (NUDIX family)
MHHEPTATMPRQSLPPKDVIRADSLRLSVTNAPWPLAIENAAAISSHFAHRQAANPSFYDGRVFVLRDVWCEGTGMKASLSLERFSSFLYWRDGKARDDATLDGFGSALVQSAEGHVLAIKASPGTLNAGRVYLPGGFIDARDLRADGVIDIEASIARELAEETGLDALSLHRRPGYLVGRHGRHCCFCIAYRATLGSEELRRTMLAGAERDTEREIADVIIVRNTADLARHDVIDHARLLIADALT